MTSVSKTILIAGYYGFKNAGDEAILGSMLDSLRLSRPELKFVVVTGRPEETKARHNVETVLWTDLRAILDAARQCDLIILGGGGVFLDYWGAKPEYLLTKNHTGNSFFAGFPLLARLNRKPCIIYSVGVGPLFSDEGKMLTRLAFELADVATVRDAESRELVKSLGVTKEIIVTADPAFNLAAAGEKALEPLTPQQDRPIVAVCLRNWDINVVTETWQQEVAAALDRLVEEEKVSLVFIPFQTLGEGDLTNDVLAAENVQALMINRNSTHLITSPLLPEEIAGIIARCDMAVGMRLHSLLFALKEGVPPVGIAYDPKTSNIMSRAGLSDYIIDLESLTSEKLSDCIKSVWSKREAISADLKLRTAEFERLALESARLALALLDRTSDASESVSARFLREFTLRQTRCLVEKGDPQADHQAVFDSQWAAIAAEKSRIEDERNRIEEAKLLLADEREAIKKERAEISNERAEISNERAEISNERAEISNERAVISNERILLAKEKDAIATASVLSAEREKLSSELAAKTAELLRIKRSLGWRLLSHYGKFKYRYLLPVYRMLDTSARRTIQTKPQTRTTLDHATALPGTWDVICFPIIDWDFRFQRPQQLMTQCARDGRRVFYFNTHFHRETPDVIISDICPNVYGVKLPGSDHLNLYREEINKGLLESLAASIEQMRDDLLLDEAICLVQLPFWAPLAFELKKRWGWKVVYDCMDEHGGFSNTNATMIKHEAALISDSDLVIATSRTLYNKAVEHAQRTVLLPNAVDFQHFNSEPQVSPLSDLPRPIIGYYGAISDWFDLNMINSAAVARPDWQFVLIGDTFGADVSSLKRLKNVHLLGEQPYTSLPAYLHQFDVACIPFLRNPLTDATNPVKFYEYLSAGKPVVATDLPELEPHRELFYPVHTPEDFVDQVDAALRENSRATQQARIEFARANTWQRRYEVLESSIKQLYPKIAIIIVSFKNLEYLRLCLQSIWLKTTYPNFQVVVVDNGAQPDIVEYLQTIEKTESRLRVILNGRNLGFARANNIGISAADDSDFVVLLNDDTVVTRGWLGNLIRRLEDKNIGLIGPVTNWAGNEAKIEVTYQTIEEMDEFAHLYTREHSGKSFDIPMLAMYCVGMRKSLLDEIGLLDEQFGVGMFEDDDFSLRVRRAGYRIVCAEDIFVHHWGKASFGKLRPSAYDKLFAANRKRFEAKWGEEWTPHKPKSR